MITPEVLFVKCFGDLPIVGTRIKIRYYNRLILRLEKINNQFGSVKIRFVTTLHELKGVVEEAHNIALEEDFRWFSETILDLNSTTSREVNEALKTILKGSPQKPEEGFREFGPIKRPLISWYSNRESFDGFIEDAFLLLKTYCNLNPLNEETGDIYKDGEIPEWNTIVKHFITSRYFKLMVQDLIVLLKLTLTSQIRMLNGEATKNYTSI